MLTIIAINNDWQVEYDTERKIYTVSYFQGDHLIDDLRFHAYEEKEVKEA